MISNEEWIKYLCEYYDVSLEEAIELGTRKSGRKPSLPGSPTCSPVSDMTMEDIWGLKERKNESDILDFYKDQGAWSAFRQTIRHIELLEYHKLFWDSIDINYSSICEYGCGAAPFLTSLLLTKPSDIFLDITLTDVDGCEHLHFAEWKLNKIIEERGLTDVEIDVCPVTPNSLPKYENPLDVVILYEVIEHVPSPIATLNNIIDHMSDDACILENFVYHGGGDDGPDLKSAADERDDFYDILQSQFGLVYGDPDLSSNQTRLWRRK